MRITHALSVPTLCPRCAHVTCSSGYATGEAISIAYVYFSHNCCTKHQYRTMLCIMSQLHSQQDMYMQLRHNTRAVATALPQAEVWDHLVALLLICPNSPKVWQPATYFFTAPPRYYASLREECCFIRTGSGLSQSHQWRVRKSTYKREGHGRKWKRINSTTELWRHNRNCALRARAERRL